MSGLVLAQDIPPPKPIGNITDTQDSNEPNTKNDSRSFLGSYGNLVYSGFIAIILFIFIFIPIKIYIGKSKKWWLKGLIYLIISLLLIYPLLHLFAKIECFLIKSSPCGLLTIGIVYPLSVIFLILGIVSLIINRFKFNKNKI